jgi:hypothetical protein
LLPRRAAFTALVDHALAHALAQETGPARGRDLDRSDRIPAGKEWEPRMSVRCARRDS